MGLWWLKTTFLSIALTSTFTSALVIPADAYPVTPTPTAYNSSGPHYDPLPDQGTGIAYPTIIAGSSSIVSDGPALGTSCISSSTATITLSGSSIVPPASQSGYYPTTNGSTITGHPTYPSPISSVLSSTTGYPVGPSAPPPENPVTSDYPPISPTSQIIGPTGSGYGPGNASTTLHQHKPTSNALSENTASSIIFNTPMPYISNYATASAAPYPTPSLGLQGARVVYGTGTAGTAPTLYFPIPTDYNTTSAYGTGYIPSSTITLYPEESGSHSSQQSTNSSTLVYPIYPTNSSVLPIYTTPYSVPPIYATPSSISPVFPSPSSVLTAIPTPIASPTTSVHVPASSLPPVSGSMTTQYSAGEPTSSDHPATTEVPASEIATTIVQVSPLPAAPTIGTGNGTVSGVYPVYPIHTATGGAVYQSSSTVPLPSPSSVVMPDYSAAPSTMTTSAIPSSVASDAYGTAAQSAGYSFAGQNGGSYMTV